MAKDSKRIGRKLNYPLMQESPFSRRMRACWANRGKFWKCAIFRICKSPSRDKSCTICGRNGTRSIQFRGQVPKKGRLKFIPSKKKGWRLHVPPSQVSDPSGESMRAGSAWAFRLPFNLPFKWKQWSFSNFMTSINEMEIKRGIFKVS